MNNARAQELPAGWNPTWSYQTEGTIAFATISDDGNYIAVGGNDNYIRVFSGTSNTLLWSYSLTGGGFAFISGNGEYIAVAAFNRLYFFQRASANLLWDTPLPGTIWASITQDGSYVAVGGSEGLYLYSSAGTLVWKNSSLTFDNSSTSFAKIAISADGNYLVASSYSSNEVYFFSRLDNTPLWIHDMGNSIWQVGISSDGKYAVAVSSNGTIRVFEQSSNSPIWTNEGGAYSFATLSPDGNYITYVSSATDKLFLYERSGTQPLWSASIVDPYLPPTSSQSCSRIVAATTDGKLYLFSRESSSPLRMYQGTPQLWPFISLDGKYVVAGEVYTYPLAGKAKVHLFTANTAPNLTSGSVTPGQGAVGTSFTYEVTYTDSDGDAPAYVKVNIDGTGYNMVKIIGTYTEGTLYRYTTSTLGTGAHTYYFEASDGTYTARLPTSGSSSGPTVTEAENDQYLIAGLSISFANAPDSVSVGETFNMTVTVTKPQGTTVTGRLRTYLYTPADQVSYPYPDPGFTYVSVVEGGWVPNEITISLGENDTSATYAFSLTVNSDVVITGSSAHATLRARLRKADTNVRIAPDSDKDFVVFPAPSFNATSLTIFPSKFALYPGYSGQVQSLVATLRDNNYSPLANETVTWSATSGTVEPSSGTTDAQGQVSVVFMAPTVTAETPQVTITASFAGDAQHDSSSGTSSGIPAVPVSENIPASTGGTVVINVIEINVTVNILVVPPNALFENKTIDVVQKPPENMPAHVMVSRIFDIGPSGTTFTTPSTITLPYNENELPEGVSEDDLAIYRRAGPGGSWEKVVGNMQVDKAANTVSVEIDHLSEYAVMAQLPTQPFAAIPPIWVIGITVIVLVAVMMAVIWRYLSVGTGRGKEIKNF